MLENIDPDVFEEYMNFINVLQWPSKRIIELECQLNEANVKIMVLNQRLDISKKWSKMWKVKNKTNCCKSI